MLLSARVQVSQRIRLFSDQSTPYLLLAPAVILVVAIVGYPIAKTIYYSLTDFIIWNPSATKWVWFRNYFDLFRDSDFLNSLTNTLQWVLLVIMFQFLFGN